MFNINEFFFKNCKIEFFMPKIQTMDFSLKLKNIIIKNEREFGEFYVNIDQFGREAIYDKTINKLVQLLKVKYPFKCKNDNEAKKFLMLELLKKDSFYYQIDELRHHNTHLKKNVLKKDPYFLKRIYAYNKNKIGKISKNKCKFFQIQYKNLNDFNIFLDKIYKILTL